MLAGKAIDTVQVYLSHPGPGSLQMAPLCYQALYEQVRRWIRKAVAASGLPMHERARLAWATTHWLRHIFSMCAITRERLLDVIPAQTGHAIIQTMTVIMSGRQSGDGWTNWVKRLLKV